MHITARQLTKCSRLTALALLFSLPFVALGGWFALSELSNNLAEWVPPDLPEMRQYREFLRIFPGDNVALMSWDGCTLEDPRLRDVGDALHRATENSPYLERVVTGLQVLESLGRASPDQSREDLKRQLQGLWVGADGRTTGLMVTFSEHADAHREEAAEELSALVAQSGRLQPHELHLAGPFVSRLALDTESKRRIYVISTACVVLALLLGWWSLGSLALSVLILGIALFSGEAALALMYFCGGKVSAVTMVLPTLVSVLATSGGVHVANYFLDALHEADPETAVEIAVARGWRPCSVAALTTAIGLGSLAVSRIEPVRTFGIFAACGILIGLLLVFLVVPGFLPLLARKRLLGRRIASRQPSRRDRFAAGWNRWGVFITSRHRGLSVLALAVMLTFGWLLTHLQTSAETNDMFLEESRIVRDHQWFEKNLGAVVPMEVLIRFPGENDMSASRRLELVRTIADELRSLEGVGGAFSVATFFPRQQSQSVFERIAREGAEQVLLQSSRDRFIEDGLIAEDNGVETWRISLRVAAGEQQTVDAISRAVRQRGEALLLKLLGEKGSQVSLEVTGIEAVTLALQHAILSDLRTSFLTAFTVIWIVVVVLMRSVTVALLAMIPNLFPTLVIFGTMSWMEVAVDVGTMMTASVALGIAVDDTLHLLTWYQRALANNPSSTEAVTSALRRCGTAMVQTSLICSLALLPWCLATFAPTVRFSWLMLTLVTAALAGDLLFFPAILVGPLGRFCFRRSR